MDPSTLRWTGFCGQAPSLVSEAGEKSITMNSLAIAAGVAATTITRLARNDDKAASALSLDLASKIVTVLDCGIGDLLEIEIKKGE
jgi:DNA-binding Xre family transcriptional regulator